MLGLNGVYVVFPETTSIRMDDEHKEAIFEFTMSECQERVVELINGWLNEAYDQGRKKGKLKILRGKEK